MPFILSNLSIRYSNMYIFSYTVSSNICAAYLIVCIPRWSFPLRSGTLTEHMKLLVRSDPLLLVAGFGWSTIGAHISMVKHRQCYNSPLHQGNCGRNTNSSEVSTRDSSTSYV